jgi:type I restriction enzyme S subunit
MIKRGIAPKYLEDGGICVINQKCIRDHAINCGLARRHNLEAKKVNPERYVQVGDVLVNSTGTGTLGRIAQVRQPPAEPTTVDTHVTIVRPITGKFYNDFFGYMLIKIEDEIASSGKGTSGQTELSRTSLQQDFTVTFPESLKEQQRIVAILDAAFERIDAAIANTEKNLANARELFESYLNTVFSERGEGWEEKELEGLSERITKGSSPKWQGVAYVEEPGVLFVTSENVGAGQMVYKKTEYVEESFNKKDSKSILCKGDVLTNIVGASIGRTAIFDRDDVANINQAVCMIRCNKDKLNNRYLSYLLNSPYFVRLLHDNEINNARANLSLTFFRKLTIPIPSLKVQEKTALKMDAVHEEAKAFEALYQQI